MMALRQPRPVDGSSILEAQVAARSRIMRNLGEWMVYRICIWIDFFFVIPFDLASVLH